MSSRAEAAPRTLVASVLGLTILVLGLGGAIVALKLRSEPVPTTAIDRNIELWKRATIANPEDDTAWVGLGMALLDAGRNGDAQGAFEDALEINDQNWTALMQLGLIAAEDDPTAALDYLARSVTAAPSGSRAIPLVAQGDLLLQQGKAEAARAAYEQATIDMPFLLDAHYGLGRALEELGDTKGALKAYKEALRFDPGNETIANAIKELRNAN